MNNPNDNELLEKLLRDQPLDPIPAGVYERLQKKAAWNQAPILPWPLLFGLVTALVILVFVISWGPLQDKPEAETPELATPIIVPAAPAPVIALALPAAKGKPVDDFYSQVGGVSTRLMTNEAPFALSFGSEIDLASSRREGLES